MNMDKKEEKSGGKLKIILKGAKIYIEKIRVGEGK